MATKRDYEAIAEEFREVRKTLKTYPDTAGHVAILWLENRLCEIFKRGNSRFSRETFRTESRPNGWNLYA